MYDMTAGGVLAAGETYLEAARRELAEELGVAGPEPRFVFKHRYRGEENPSWSALYEVTWDGPVTPQASEIAWGGFLTEEELVVSWKLRRVLGALDPAQALELVVDRMRQSKTNQEFLRAIQRANIS
jgi:8-oxo-dGTP pyrophosphatase MutT (NUDIX family)